MNEQKKWRPFHEGVLDAIAQASTEQLRCLGELLKTTIIPSGHEAISTAYGERCDTLGWPPAITQGLRVRESLLEQLEEKQKRAVAEKTLREFDTPHSQREWGPAS